MDFDIDLRSGTVDRDGVRLAYVEAGPDAPVNPPLVFIHGLIGDHRALLPQIKHFAATHRVVAVHLRGCGDSDRPEQDYTLAGLADDVAWQCEALGLRKPLIVGHSLGGAVALELTGRHVDLPAGIVMIDSIVFPDPAFGKMAEGMVEAFSGPQFLAAARAQAFDLYLEYDGTARRDALLAPVFDAHLNASQ